MNTLIRTFGIAALIAAPTSTASAEQNVASTGVRGQVVDAKTGDPLGDATIRVIKGGSGQVVHTDDNGNFVLPLPPGTYQLRVYYPLYEGRRVTNVIVSRHSMRKLRVPLPPSNAAILDYVVFAAPERTTEAGLLELRKRSVSVSDSLSAQEMSRSGDSSASDAVKRVVSATITDGRYINLRGLGGRYVTALLNGVTLPSPEPDRQAVPLDLFPTSLLSNLVVAKSYDAAYPGTFGGGTLLIETNTYPKRFTLSLKASTSANTVSTLQSNNTYRGGSLDFLGYDDGTRSLPGLVPRDGPARLNAPGMDAATMENIGESFANNWNVNESTTHPNIGLGATAGDTLKHRGREFGYLASLNYGRKLKGRTANVAKVRSVDDGLEYREQVTSRRGSESAKIGGLVAFGYELTKHHRVNVFTLYTHNGSSSAQRVSGLNEADGMQIDSTRMRFVERALSFSQMRTSHRWPKLRNLALTWQGNASFTSRSEPDTRDVTYNVLSDNRVRFKNETGSGERYFSDLSERSIGTGADAELPVTSRVRFKLGGSVQHGTREFSTRRFRMAFVGTDPSVLTLPPEEMFSREHVGPSFRLEERTLQSDAYDATQTLMGGYSSIEVDASKRLKIASGIRYERSTQELTPGSPFALGQPLTDDRTDRADSDFLPTSMASLALTSSMNVRAAYSYTLARPRFRELSPFLFFDYTRRRSVSGNPELVQTRIHNADLRWEWFLGDADVVAASLFYKKFRDPIESVIVSASGGDVSFANARSANTRGIELEARSTLGRFHDTLDTIRVGANLALIRSRVELRDEQVGVQTSAERPLQGQSPYVVNLSAGYDGGKTEAFALYNVIGRRIAEVGFDTLPDVYEQPFHRVDLVANRRLNPNLKLKFAATNILNRSISLKQGDLSVLRYKPGVGLSLSLSWSPK